MSNKSLFENGNLDSNFDQHFTRIEKTITRTWTAIIVMWVIGGIAYVAWHFIQKVW